MATLPDRAPAPALPENLLGVCAAIAECTGAPVLAIRIGFILAMLGACLEGTIAAYLVLAVAFAAAGAHRIK